MLTPDAKPAFGQESLNGTATLFPCNQDGTTTPAPGLSRILTARVRDRGDREGRGHVGRAPLPSGIVHA